MGHVRIKCPITMVTNSAGRTFVARFCPVGARYGRTGLYRHESAVVEFYDSTDADDAYDRSEGFGPLGQVVSTYDVRTLRESRGGINLDAGVREWCVTAENVCDVVAWLDTIELRTGLVTRTT
jgi:hypothetical protein